MFDIEVKGIPFFLLSTRLENPVLELLEARFGLKGFAIYVKLLCRIYGEEGYYCLWDSDIAEVLASKWKVEPQFITNVVDFLVKRGLFDKKLFDNLGILTSTAIQDHYCKTNSRRKEIKMRNCFLCDNFNKNVYKNLIIVYKKGEIVDDFSIKENNVIESNGMECNVTEIKEVIEQELGHELNIEEERIFERISSFYDDQLIMYALREMIIKGIKSLKYLEGILKNWKERGYDAKKYEEEN